MRATRKKVDGGISTTYRYKGSYEEEIQRCINELGWRTPDLAHYKELYLMVKKEYESRQKRVDDLNEFIHLARTKWIPERDAKLSEIAVL